MGEKITVAEAQALVGAVYSACARLNQALRSAHDVGLEIEVLVAYADTVSEPELMAVKTFARVDPSRLK